MPTQKVGSKKFKGVPKPFRRLLKSILVEMVSPFSFKFTCFLKGQTFCVAIILIALLARVFFCVEVGPILELTGIISDGDIGIGAQDVKTNRLLSASTTAMDACKPEQATERRCRPEINSDHTKWAQINKHIITAQALIIAFCLGYILITVSFPGIILTIGVIIGSFSLWEEDTYILLMQYWVGVYSVVMFIALINEHLKGNEINRKNYYPGLIAGSLLSVWFGANLIISDSGSLHVYLIALIILWPTICAVQIFIHNRKLKLIDTT